MAVYEILYTRFTAHSGLSALIGTRAYPVILPQNPTLPAITYQLISNPRLGQTARLYTPRYQVHAWGERYITAHAVADQVIAALEEFSDTDGTPQLKASLEDDKRDTYDPETDLKGVIVDFILFTAE